MKKANATAKGSAMLALLVILAGVLFFSCKKTTVETVTATNNDMVAIAGITGGETLEGSTISGTDEDSNLNIVFNRGSKYIILQKIPGMPYESPDEIKSAVIITSKYGVVMKDVATNKVWLFANNDEESLQKFETIKQGLHGSFVSTTVFGVTVVNVAS